MTAIRDMFRSYVEATPKTWRHDRMATVGASTVFGCSRKAWYERHGGDRNPDYTESMGAARRGDMIEAAWFVPVMTQMMTPGLELRWAGHNQVTLIEGDCSATPDGLVVNVSNHDVELEGINIEPHGCVLIECKSFDPRSNPTRPKDAHVGQVQMQLGLVRTTREYKPECAIIVYINASDILDVRTFVIARDEAVFATGRDRAAEIMTGPKPLPEGRIAGGAECRYCPFTAVCSGVPSHRTAPETPAPMDSSLAAAGELATAERQAAAAADAAKVTHAAAQAAVRQMLELLGTDRVTAPWGTVRLQTVAGRNKLDIDAAVAAGVDLAPYTVAGQPHQRLTVVLHNQE